MTPAKDQLRRQLLAARRAVPDEAHDAEASALAGHAALLVEPGQTVCAYVPVGREPGSPELLDVLRDSGVRVLLPVAREPGMLRWAEHVGELVAAPFGLREPAGTVLGPQAIGEATLVLVPALAVDRSGIRLGRGGGFYDRTLGSVDPAAKVVAVVRDDELLDAVPAEAHDVRVGWALTPVAGLTQLG